MIDIVGTCYRFIGDVLHGFRAQPSKSNVDNVEVDPKPASKPLNLTKFDDLAAQALTTVFGMDAEGRIKKEQARKVVENLGLIGGMDETKNFELPGSLEEDQELKAEEIVDGLDDDQDGLRRSELMKRAFTVFDEDGDGYIDATEIKRVLECLGLAKGWDMDQFEKMIKAVDLNFDGKVDLSEFELMMGAKIM
ncbi:hypothetical protein C5167_011826 [Papaver somniferum]|uniref:calmodulin-like protein 6 n=1 Tax=Papaver somniferum TaxID=3469 RepID=UPI000E6FE76B|nr:calmodulin-like protein 6 [Papaver somniferum]RZC85196.1 hypothetical protein C5167_011826 [Papaver somniferum]